MNAEQALIDYANRYLEVNCKGVITVDQVIGFAKMLRAGCLQDLERLISLLADEQAATINGKDALLLFVKSFSESFESWGLPDCDCQTKDCVYCANPYQVACVGHA